MSTDPSPRSKTSSSAPPACGSGPASWATTLTPRPGAQDRRARVGDGRAGLLGRRVRAPRRDLGRARRGALASGRVRRALGETRGADRAGRPLRARARRSPTPTSSPSWTEGLRRADAQLLGGLEEARLFSGRARGRRRRVSINAGEGGTDAQDWAEMLLRMYLRWAERRGLRTDLKEVQEGTEAGIKSADLHGARPERLRAAVGRERRPPAGAPVARSTRPTAARPPSPRWRSPRW